MISRAIRSSRLVRFCGLAACAVLFLCASKSFSADTGSVRWTSPAAVVRTGGNADGYDATVYHRRAYVADVTTLTSGANSYSRIWFSTNRTGKWTRTLVAKIHDDPNTGGGAVPRIVVIPASGQAVIVVMHATDNNGRELLTFVEQPGGAWRQEQLPMDTAVGAISAPSVPSLTAQGTAVAMAFSATYSQGVSACSGQVSAFVTKLTGGSGGWSKPRNVTADYCGPKGGYADDPVLAFGPSGKLFMVYQCQGDPNGSPGALCMRSGDFGPETEKVIGQNTADWSLDVHRLYDLKVGAAGTPHIVYIMLGPDRRVRLMYATRTAGGWMEDEIATGAHNTGVQGDAGPAMDQLMWPSIALGASGPAVAYVGSVKYPLGGNSSLATFLMRESDGKWSKPVNFTGSKFGDAAPILGASGGLLHLFMSRSGGQSYLYAHEAPLPLITFSLSQAGQKNPLRFAAKRTIMLRGTVGPSVSKERIKACMGKKMASSRWTAPRCAFEAAQLKGNEVEFKHDYLGTTAGHYRLRVEVGETTDHLAGVSQWSEFAVK